MRAKPTRLGASVVGATALALVLGAPVAQAAFPGGNGRIVFTSESVAKRAEIVTMTSAGQDMKRLTRTSVADSDAAYSASGRKLVFVQGARRRAEIWTMNADGSGKRRLTRNSFADAAPSWSPNGRRIVFRSIRPSPTGGAPSSGIYVMNADGSGQVPLATGDDPVFSPDGTKIAFVSFRTGPGEIFVMNADGSGQTALTANTSGDGEPDWSPDGRRIAFQSERDGNAELYVMNADGSGQRRLTRTPRAGEGLPAFSPDGRQIAFQQRLLRSSGRVKRADDVFVMRANGARVKRLTFATGYDGRPDWQPKRR